MKKVIKFLFSSRLMAVLIAIFAISIAVATFIERDYGTATARASVYHSWWFQLMLFLGIMNLTGTIFVNKLYKREKLSLFAFHIAFLFVLLGSAITHYFGFNGVMHIREAESSNMILSDDAYFSAKLRNGKELDEAVEFCRNNGIEFYAINKNYPEEIFWNWSLWAPPGRPYPA